MNWWRRSLGAEILKVILIVGVIFALAFALTMLVFPQEADATDWYVRPSTDISINGDGTAYTEAASEGATGAWRGYSNIVQGAGGVQAGDTLYWAGTWIYGYNGLPYAGFDITESGTDGSPITFKSYEPDPAVFVAARKAAAASFTTYNDIYLYSGFGYDPGGTVFEGTVGPGGEAALLQSVDSIAACEATEGSWYYERVGDPLVRYLYVHPFDDTLKDTYYNCVGTFDLNSNEYLIFDGFYIYGRSSFPGFGGMGDHNIFRNLHLFFSPSSWFGGDFNHCTIEDNKCYESRNFCYPGGATSPDSNYNTIQRNEVYDGYPYGTPDGDSGAFSWSGGHDNSFLHNKIFSHRGMGFNLYAYNDDDGYNNTIAYNYIRLIDTGGAGYHRGMDINGSVTSGLEDFSDRNRNLRVYGNVIDLTGVAADDGVGIRFKAAVPSTGSKPFICNNTILGYESAIVWVDNGDDGGTFGATIKNNILNSSVSGKKEFVISNTANMTSWNAFDCDYNQYPTSFSGSWRGTANATLAAWITDVEDDGNTGIDDNSIQDNDLNFEGAGTYSDIEDYTPTATSPCLDAGVDVSLTTDAAGNTIPSGDGYDIGALELEQTVATPTADPVAGTYAGTQSVTLSCATSGATIYYTTDGSTPDDGDTAYSGPISVATSLTLKAIAYKTDWTTGGVLSVPYVIEAIGGGIFGWSRTQGGPFPGYGHRKGN